MSADLSPSHRCVTVKPIVTIGVAKAENLSETRPSEHFMRQHLLWGA
jgi:hypothetical protein